MSLTSREKRAFALYNLLMAAPDKWWTQKEICDYVGGYVYTERPNDRCASIRNDMLWLNNNSEVEKIVVCENYCFKIATEQETKHYYAARIRRLKNQVKQCKDLEHKIKRNGHADFLEERWWETYVEEC